MRLLAYFLLLSVYMRALFTAYFMLMLVPSLGYAGAVGKITSSRSYKEAQLFLERLGFESYAERAINTLTTDKNIDDIGRAALTKVARYYQQLESSKQMAAVAYTLLQDVPCFTDSACVERSMLVALITQQVMPLPLISAEPMRDSKYQFLRGDSAYEYRRNYYEQRGVARYNVEKANALKIFKHLAAAQSSFSGETNEISYEQYLDRNLTSVFEPNYLANTRQQNRHFGRALTAVYLKLARAMKCSVCESELKESFDRNDIRLQQVVGAGYRLKNDQVDKMIQLKSGDLALEYSSGGQAFMISVGLEPVDVKDYNLAIQHKLISSYALTPVALNASYSSIRKRQKQNYVIADSDQRNMDDYWDADRSTGFSHVGLVEVKTDVETNISLAWIWDIFPQSDRLGVVRPMTPEGFAYPERFLRIGFARYNPEKMRSKFLQQKQSRGYVSRVWESYGSKMDKNEKGNVVPTIDRTTRHSWMTNISEGDLNALIDKANQMDGNTWYNAEMLPRVFNQVRRYIYGPEVLVFAAGLVNAKSMAYCSQFVTLAFLQSVNFDLQTRPDQYRNLPHVLAKTLPDVVPLDLKDRIISPAGLVWQSDALEGFVQLNFSRSRLSAQKQFVFQGVTMVDQYMQMTSSPHLAGTKIRTQLSQIDKDSVDDSDDED